MANLAHDMSNIMVLDALFGNQDRVPGGNLHMRSVERTRIDTGERLRNGPSCDGCDRIWDLGEVRLFALDNGSGLSSRHGSGLLDLRGERVAGTRLERFQPEVVERLRGLARRALGHGCDTFPYEDEVAAIWGDYFRVSGREAEYAISNLTAVVDYIDRLESRYGDDIYLTRPSEPTESAE